MSNPNEPALIATSRQPSATIPLEALGRPGTHSLISIVPQFHGCVTSIGDILDDPTPREFLVACRLSKGPLILGQDASIKGDFDRKDGASYLVAPSGASKIRIGTSWGDFDISVNDAGELSMVELRCDAVNHQQARARFMEATYPALDHFSYAYDVPVFVTVIRVFDCKHKSTHIAVASPFGYQVVDDRHNELFSEMRPIYAMYREAKTATSNFYKFLCLYKIMEGLLGKMRGDVYRRIRRSGLNLERDQIVVPDGAAVPDDLRKYVGTSMKGFFDKVLTNQFRHAVAHLQTKGHMLDVSSPLEQERFAGLALAADVCARALISDHECLLTRLSRRSISSGGS